MSRPANTPSGLDVAVAELIALPGEMWADLGPYMTCSEADSLVRLLRAVGCDDHADALQIAHALGDNDDDEDNPDHLALAARLTRDDPQTYGSWLT